MKKVLAFISSTECEDSIKLLHLFEGPFKEELEREGVKVVDASVDAMAFADELKDLDPDEVLLVAVKRRGREPGLYVRRPERVKADNLTLAKMAVATLTGYLDVDALLDGLHAFGPQFIDRITVLECEPPCRHEELKERVRELLGLSS